MNCQICDENNWVKKYNNLVMCGNCGFIRAANKYFKINPQKIYSEKYFNGLDYTDYAAEKEALSVNFTDRLNRIREHKKNGALLEIGCAYGYFLKLAEKKFNCTGIDLSASTTKIAKANTKKSKIVTGEFLDKRFRNKFDVVVMFDVIEHLKNPKKYLLKINQLLMPEGIVVIETGDIGALLPRLQKDKWRLITPPTHLNYFTKKTLVKLLEKTGYNIVDSKYVGFNRTFKQIFYRLGVDEKFLPNIISNRCIKINTYDLMFIIAQKVQI